MPGRNHAVEPEEEDELLAGALWERDVYAPHEALPDLETVLFGPLDQAGVPGISQARALWRAAGSPTPWDEGGRYIALATELARQAGFDVYDSDTRTWIYGHPIECGACEPDTEACWTPVVAPAPGLLAKALLDDLQQRFPGLADGELDVSGGDVVAWLSERLHAWREP